MKPTQEELENIAQWCNDGHEGGAVQSTFLERLKVIMRCCSYQKSIARKRKQEKMPSTMTFNSWLKILYVTLISYSYYFTVSCMV
jgi:hypothetical protein